MKTLEFKKGDKVVFNGLGDSANNPSWVGWAARDGLKEGETYVISCDVRNSVCLEDKIYGYEARWFSLWKTDVLAIILRRPVDRKSIGKFLDSNGYKQEDTDPDDPYMLKSRIINVHFRCECNGQRTYNASIGYDKGTKQAIAMNTAFLKEPFFGHKNIVVIKTKPSVNEAINQIKKYI